MRDDNDDTIVTDLSEPTAKKLTHAKQDQLANARVKALESRRRTQKAGLESRLHEVKVLLGEIDPKHAETVKEVLMSQERQLRREQRDMTLQLMELIKGEAAKRVAENASLKRSVERLSVEISARKKSNHETPKTARSTVSTAVASSKQSTVPLSKVSALPK